MAGISLRSGCPCNPGVREVALRFSTAEMAAAFKDKDRLRYEEFLHVIDGKTIGAARASLGLGTTFADVYRFREFAAGFRDVPSDAVEGLSCPAPVPAAWGISGRGARRGRPSRWEGGVGTVRDALQLPDMRRIELGYGMSITGELAGTVALVVYALGAGGAALVAAYAASRTVAGMGVALVLTGLTSRLRRDRLLRWITGARTVLLAAAAPLAPSHHP